MLRLLVQLRGVDLEIEDKNGYTPLFYAIMKKQIDMVRLLSEAGANLEHKEHMNRTPLYFAASTPGCTDIT